MEGSSHFSVPHQDSEAVNFKPLTKLPDHLNHYAKIATDIGAKMNPLAQAAVEYTNIMALRSAAMPHSE